MAKEVQMTFRVEPELRDAFAEATALVDRPAAQVLRELMRGYVAHSREPVTIDAAEGRLRAAAISAGIASVALEGFTVPTAYRDEADRFVRGEIDFSALTATVDELARQL